MTVRASIAKPLLLFVGLICLLTTTSAAVPLTLGSDFTLSPGTDAIRIALPPDSVPLLAGAPTENEWQYRLKTRNININDTTVQWPGFVDFCLRVYRWADRVFNTYDPEYVTGTGYRGRIKLKPEFWTTAFTFDPEDSHVLSLAAPFNAAIGVNVGYSILSVGYTYDLSTKLSHTPSKSEKTNIGFKCARLAVDLNYWRDKRGTYINHYGQFNYGKPIHEYFDGMNFRAVTATGIYFFNSSRFCLGAAYDASMTQHRTAGSAVLGLNGSFYKIDINFDRLPQNLKDYYMYPYTHFNMFYNSINVVGGYSYNVVIGRKWLFNITALPGFGVTTSFSDSTVGNITQYSSYIKGMMAFTYNNKRFFYNVQGVADSNFYISRPLFTTMSVINLNMTFGLRF